MGCLHKSSVFNNQKFQKCTIFVDPVYTLISECMPWQSFSTALQSSKLIYTASIGALKNGCNLQMQ